MIHPSVIWWMLITIFKLYWWNSQIIKKIEYLWKITQLATSGLGVQKNKKKRKNSCTLYMYSIRFWLQWLNAACLLKINKNNQICVGIWFAGLGRRVFFFWYISLVDDQSNRYYNDACELLLNAICRKIWRSYIRLGWMYLIIATNFCACVCPFAPVGKIIRLDIGTTMGTILDYNGQTALKFALF